MNWEINLLDYQGVAVDKAYPLEGFLCADEMGTGKTVMSLGEIQRKSQEMSGITVLVATLKSGISVWEDHASAMLPDFEFISPRTQLTKAELKYLRSGANVILGTNWAQARINMDLARIQWTYTEADEAQNICNRRSQQTRAWKRIKSHRRRAWTGTPVINRPDDLWSILNWLYPRGPEWLSQSHRGLFTSYWRFFEKFCLYDEMYNGKTKYKVVTGVRNPKLLREIISPFTIRRKKKTVMPELPDKYYTTIRVSLTPKQRKAYNSMKDDALAWVGEGEDKPLPAPVAIAKLTRLRQFCVAHADIDDFGDVILMEPSSKLDAVMDLISSTEESVVIFSQFSQPLDLLEVRLDKAKVSYTRLGGTVKARRKSIEDFQRGDVRLFLSTIKMGGASITLTRSSTVVFIDRSWSPAENEQSEDRLHRRGQTNAVQVVNISARNTVDNYVERKLAFKRSIIRQILEGDDG